MNIDVSTIKDLTVFLGFISLLVSGVIYIKALGINNKARAKENRVIIKALFAICDALKKQGCNGPITEAHNELRELLYDKVSTE